MFRISKDSPAYYLTSVAKDLRDVTPREKHSRLLLRLNISAQL